MVQRKENAAARAALARRRQRAAQTLHRPSQPSSSTENQTQISSESMKTNVSNIEWRPPTPPQASSYSVSLATATGKATETSSIVSNNESKSKKKIIENFDQRTATTKTPIKYGLERGKAIPEKSSTILDASFNKSKSYSVSKNESNNAGNRPEISFPFIANKYNNIQKQDQEKNLPLLQQSRPIQTFLSNDEDDNVIIAKNVTNSVSQESWSK